MTHYTKPPSPYAFLSELVRRIKADADAARIVANELRRDQILSTRPAAELAGMLTKLEAIEAEIAGWGK